MKVVGSHGTNICHVICTPGTPNDPCFDWSSDLDKLTGARCFFPTEISRLFSKRSIFTEVAMLVYQSVN